MNEAWLIYLLHKRVFWLNQSTAISTLPKICISFDWLQSDQTAGICLIAECKLNITVALLKPRLIRKNLHIIFVQTVWSLHFTGIVVHPIKREYHQKVSETSHVTYTPYTQADVFPVFISLNLDEDGLKLIKPQQHSVYRSSSFQSLWISLVFLNGLCFNNLSRLMLSM